MCRKAIPFWARRGYPVEGCLPEWEICGRKGEGLPAAPVKLHAGYPNHPVVAIAVARFIAREKEKLRLHLLRRSVLASLLGLVAVVPSVALASPFTVTNLNDSGRGSLRRATQQANYYGGLNLIRFAAGLTGTITLTTGPLTVYSRLNIQGPGASGLVLSGGSTHRIFDIATGSLQLSGVTIRDGQAVLGGGILLEAGSSAQISNCAFTGNTATDGGGIFATQSHLTVTGCTFTNNTAVPGRR